MKKILFTAVAIVGLVSGTSALHAEGAVCPVTGKTASGETAKKDSTSSSKKDNDSCCSAGKNKK